MPYTRVIPRDLFNEAKLLKCLGRLALVIHDGRDKCRNEIPAGLRTESDGQPFRIAQRPGCGALYCENATFWMFDVQLFMQVPYNSREPYPLQCVLADMSEMEVFDTDGDLSFEFYEYLKLISNRIGMREHLREAQKHWDDIPAAEDEDENEDAEDDEDVG